MELNKHIVVSIGIGLLVYLYYKSITYGIVSFIAGVFIDLDHFFDYFKETGVNINIKRFFRFCYAREFKKLYLFLHSYEIIILVLFLGIYLKNTIFIVICISLLQHLLFDQFTNYVKPFAYFVFYRIFVDFCPQKILKYPYQLKQ